MSAAVDAHEAMVRSRLVAAGYEPCSAAIAALDALLAELRQTELWMKEADDRAARAVERRISAEAVLAEIMRQIDGDRFSAIELSHAKQRARILLAVADGTQEQTG